MASFKLSIESIVNCRMSISMGLVAIAITVTFAEKYVIRHESRTISEVSSKERFKKNSHLAVSSAQIR